MIGLLPERCFLAQFDKGNATCVLPSGFSLRHYVAMEKNFDLLDKQPNIVQQPGDGCITYTNRTDDKIVIIDYENLVQSFPSAINTGKSSAKCCDFLVYSENKTTFFICNELSTSRTKLKWPDARNQFADTVRRLLNCAETKQIVDVFKYKWCVLSTEIEPVNTPDDMAGAFGIPYTLFKKAEQLPWAVVERMGFTIWEANQVVYEDSNTVSLLVR